MPDPLSVLNLSKAWAVCFVLFCFVLFAREARGLAEQCRRIYVGCVRGLICAQYLTQRWDGSTRNVSLVCDSHVTSRHVTSCDSQVKVVTVTIF
jgi:hypothetical protein